MTGHAVFADEAPVADIVFCFVCGEDTLRNEAGKCDWCHTSLTPQNSPTCVVCGQRRKHGSNPSGSGGYWCGTCMGRAQHGRGTCALVRVHLWPEELRARLTFDPRKGVYV